MFILLVSNSNIPLNFLRTLSRLFDWQVRTFLVFRHSLSLDIHMVWKWFLLPHPQQVWPYAEQTVFPPWFSLDFRFSCMFLSDYQSRDLHAGDREASSRQPSCFEFLSLFSVRWLRLVPFDDILWRDCLYSMVAARVFKSSIAFSASKSCGSVYCRFFSLGLLPSSQLTYLH